MSAQNHMADYDPTVAPNDISRSGQTLFLRAVKGGFWVFLLRTANILLFLIRTVILCRLLDVEDFAQVDIALLTMALLEILTQTGFQAALIQTKGDIKPYLDSAWTLGFIRAVILFTLLYLAAPYVPLFFKGLSAFRALQVEVLIQVMAFSFILQALTNIGIVYFRKDLHFQKHFLYQFAGMVADFTVAVIAAVIWRNAWALALGLLVGHLARFLISYALHPYRPNFRWEPAKIKELFSFGKWILATGILTYLLTRGDAIFVQKMLGLAMLGLYARAYHLSNRPATEITQVINQVSFPAFAQLQDDIGRMKKAYLKILQITAFLSFPLAGLIFVLAGPFVGFLGPKWSPMVPVVRVLVLWGALRAMAGANSSVLMALKRPDVVTKLSLVKLVILAAIIYPLSARWAILGTAWAVVIASLCVTPVTFWITVKRLLEGKITQALSAMATPLLATLLMVMPAWAVVLAGPEPLGPQPPVAQVIWAVCFFAIAALIGTACYLLCTYLLDKKLKQNLYASIKETLAGLLK